MEEKYYLALSAVKFIQYLQDIPQEAVDNWYIKNNLEIPPQPVVVKEVYRIRRIRISSSSYIYR